MFLISENSEARVLKKVVIKKSVYLGLFTKHINLSFGVTYSHTIGMHLNIEKVQNQQLISNNDEA